MGAPGRRRATAPQVTDQSTRAVNSAEIGEALDREVVGGWVDLRSESPEPAESLLPVELPELNNGPHFFYGLQWWFFGALAIFGFFYLVYDEVRGGRGPARPAAERPSRGRRRRAARPGASGWTPRARTTPTRTGQRLRSSPPSTGSITPVRNDAAGDSTNAATAPNSSGSP